MKTVRILRPNGDTHLEFTESESVSILIDDKTALLTVVSAGPDGSKSWLKTTLPYVVEEKIDPPRKVRDPFLAKLMDEVDKNASN